MFLEIENISKQIGAEEVLKNITISMDRGRVYGLQGKNGCGKSMLMRVICGLVLPTLGKEISFPKSIGVLIEKPGFLNSYTGFQNLEVLASIKKVIGREEIINAVKRVGLEDVMDKKYRTYSLGMKQKLGIAAAVMEKPDIVILDEPANALDEKSEKRLWEIIKEEKERGALVIISCHTSELLEEAADEIYRMDLGEIKEHIAG